MKQIHIVWQKHTKPYHTFKILQHWKRNWPSLIEEARIKRSVIIEKAIAAKARRLPHLSSAWVDNDDLMIALQLLCWQLVIVKMNQWMNSCRCRGRGQRVPSVPIIVKIIWIKMTVRGTMVRSEVYNSWCFCLGS